MLSPLFTSCCLQHTNIADDDMMYLPFLSLQRRFDSDPAQSIFYLRSIFTSASSGRTPIWAYLSSAEQQPAGQHHLSGKRSGFFVICAHQHLLEFLLEVIFLQPLLKFPKNQESEIHMKSDKENYLNISISFSGSNPQP